MVLLGRARPRAGPRVAARARLTDTAGMTGRGVPQMVAFGPDGTRHQLAWGPAFHLGSNWDKPGDEWGAGYVFTVPGCWDLRAVRGQARADVWLLVAAR